jgi:hypothetical protein
MGEKKIPFSVQYNEETGKDNYTALYSTLHRE